MAQYDHKVSRPKNDRIPVSAVVITLNAERWLDAVLEPLHVCAEILILDSGSSDRTRQIAEDHGAVWHVHPFVGYGPQKRRAIAMATFDWIISVDADEILDSDAREGLAVVDWAKLDATVCFTIRRRPFIGDREIRHGHWVPDPVLRVFNRRVHDFSEDVVHESVTPTGAVRALPGALEHHSYDDLAAVFRADYHRLKAAQYVRDGRRVPGVLNLGLRALWALVYSLVLKRGVLDGRAGLVIALSAAVNAVLGLALAGEGTPFERSSQP
jgi:glycosyltransferase involved in cell wall biosynthesis